jgi:IclR family transcriptional regulator, blcABC operon repressor
MERSSSGPGAKAASPAVTRAALILDELAAARSALGVTEIARRLSLPKSSVLNLCNSLVEVGLARRRQGGFALGSKVVHLSAAYLSCVSIVHEFQEVCLERPAALEETTQLAVLDGQLSVVYLARRDGTQPVRLSSDIGRSLPATCTAVGRAILAQLPADELRARLPPTGQLPTLTPGSIASTDELMSDLEQIRRDGFAFDDEQTAEGVVCLGAAVPSGPGEERAAVSFTFLKARASSRRIKSLSAEIRGIADDLGERIGRPATS